MFKLSLNTSLFLSFVFLAFSHSVYIFYLLEKTENFYGIYISAPFLCLGMLFLILSVRISNIKYARLMPAPSFAFYIIFIVWSFVLIIRGFTFDLIILRDMWGISIFAWAFLVPCSVVLGADIQAWRTIISLLFVFGLLGILIFLVSIFFFFRPSDLHLAYGCVILFMFMSFFSKQTFFYKAVVIIGSIVTLITSILALTRNQVLEKGLLIIFALTLFYVIKNKFSVKRKISVVFCVFIILFLLVYVHNNDNIFFINPSINERIVAFKNKLPVNSRVSENNNLYLEFIDDLSAVDFMFGRGIMGSYYGYVGSSTKSSIYRRAIECGYLYMILKGGIVILVPFLYLSISSVYYGLFRSSNWFAKSCAFIVVVRMVAMVPYGLPEANIPYIIFWMAIGACQSKGIRCLTNDEIRNLIEPYRFLVNGRNVVS